MDAPDQNWVWPGSTSEEQGDRSPKNQPDFLLDRAISDQPSLQPVFTGSKSANTAIIPIEEVWRPDELLVSLKALAPIPEPSRDGPSPLSSAVVLYLEGNQGQALAQLDAAIASGRADLNIQIARSQLLYKLDHFEEALAAYEVIQRRAPDRSGFSFERGVCLERLGRYPEALLAFSDALRRNPTDGEARRGLGIVQLHLGRHAEALNTFEQCLATSDDPVPLFGKAISLQYMGRTDEAEAIYCDFLRIQPDCNDALVNMIALSLEGGQEDSILRYSGLLLKSRCDSSPALETLAEIEFVYENYEAAASLCSRVIQHSPDSYEAWFNLGVARHSTRQFQDAVEAFRSAAKLRPDSVDAQLALGAACQDAGLLPDAMLAYQCAVKLQPENDFALLKLAVAEEVSGNAASAEECYNDLVKRSPASEEGWYRLGQLRFARKDYSGALECFDQCLKLRPQWPHARYNLAIAVWKNGDAARATSLLEPLDAELPDALHVLAQIALQQQDTGRAKELLSKLLDSGERSPETLYNMALLLQDEGCHDKAISLYQEAIERRPEMVEALERLGQISLKLGRQEEAQEYFHRARPATSTQKHA